MWKPRRANDQKVSGETHGVTVAPSSVQVTLVGEPVVVQANRAGFWRLSGRCVNVTVGFATVLEITVQL